MLDGGWRNKLATPIFQERVRCSRLRVTANPAAPLPLASTSTDIASISWCSISGSASLSSDVYSSEGICPESLDSQHRPLCTGYACTVLCVCMTCALVEQGIPVLDTWNQTTELYKFHRDNGHGYECSHFCFPSAPQARGPQQLQQSSCVECVLALHMLSHVTSLVNAALINITCMYVCVWRIACNTCIDQAYSVAETCPERAGMGARALHLPALH